MPISMSGPVFNFKSTTFQGVCLLGRGLTCEPTLWEIMGWESSDVIRLDLAPLLQGQTRIAKLKSGYNLFIIGPSCLGCEANLY